MFISRRVFRPDFQPKPNLFFFLLIIPLFLLLNCLNFSENAKSNRIFQKYLRYYTENNFDYLAQHRFDQHLIRVKPANIKAYVRTIDFYENELASLDTAKLSSENKIDFVLLKRHLGQLRFNFLKRKIWQHDPLWYCELVGHSLYWPTVLQNVNREQAANVLLLRLKQLPRFFSQARENLITSSELRISLAQQKSEALKSFITRDIVPFIQEFPELSDSLDIYQPPALEALKLWQSFLKQELPAEGTERFLAGDLTKWLTLILGEGNSLQEIKKISEREFNQVLRRMQIVTEEVYQKYFPRRLYQRAAAREKGFVLATAIGHIRKDYLKPDAFLPFIQETMAESERFLQFKNIMKVPNTNAISLMPLPEFLPGEPFIKVVTRNEQLIFLMKLHEAAWRWSEELDFSKYFNRNRLKVVALSRLIPGQVLQLMYADSLASPVQHHFVDLPMRLGWQIFAPYLMRKSGFTGYDPAFILMQQMDYFHAALGTHLCLKYHFDQMTEEVLRQELKERGLLEGIILEIYLQEIMLHPERVIARFWGFYQLRELYEDVRSYQQNHFNLTHFNQKLLNSGFVPINSVRRYLMRP